MSSTERPHFTEDDLPLTREQLLAREKWMMTAGNWREDHSAPSAGEHYRYMWKWDSAKGVVINARRDDPDRAAIELETLLRYVDPMTGFMPNKIFETADSKTWRDYPEAWNFNDNKKGTSYTQPPLEAWAAMETYGSFVRQDREQEGVEFLKTIFGTAEEGNYTGLKGSYAYFHNHRRNPDSPEIGIAHPNETGRDSDEANKPWLVGKGRYNAPIEWAQMQLLGWKLGRRGRDPNGKRIDWIPEKVRDTYWVNDVMFNAMYVSNLRYMADIAGILHEAFDDPTGRRLYQKDLAEYFIIARETEEAILDRAWDSEKKFFYNQDKNGEHVPVDSVTGLFALMLENISVEQTEALLEKLEDPEWFGTDYPIPTHAARSEFYDPEPSGFKNTFTPQWSGPVWIDVNHIIVEEGLVPRAEAFANPESKSYNPELAVRLLGRAGIIAAKTEELLANDVKSMEYYSPKRLGRGMRVADFMWTNLGLHFEKYKR